MSKGEGYHKLWRWFGLSRASFIIMPRVLVHAMPDEWQGEMAELLKQYDDAFDQNNIGIDGTMVVAKKDNKFCRIPKWLLNYRHPNNVLIDELRPLNHSGDSDE